MDENNNVIHTWGTDQKGHGTAVAGIIGAKRNNGEGIAGIAGGDGSTDTSGVSLLDFKLGFEASYSGNWISMSVIDAARSPLTYHNWQGIANGLPSDEYYYQNAPGYGIYIGNHSYSLKIVDQPKKPGELKDLPDTTGWTPPPLPIEECHLCREAYLFSLQNGVINATSRGNNINIDNLYDPLGLIPQAYHDSWVITVGASGRDGNWLNAPYNTSTGEHYNSPIGENLDLIAPGCRSDIASARSSIIPGFDTYGYYRAFNGTSASTPHVSGVAALLLSYYNQPCYSNQNLDPADVEYILERSATDIGTVPNDTIGWGRLNAYEALKMIDYPKYQIVHPNRAPISQVLVEQDTITLKLNKPLNPIGKGPLGTSFPLELEQTNLVERLEYQMTYEFGEYIQPTTDLLDVWLRHSQTNSLARFEDTITILEGLPSPSPVFHLDEFEIEPMAIIDTVLNDSIIKLTGYYYHFIKKYFENQLEYPPLENWNYWYPINPNTDTLIMAYSIYLHDENAPFYSFPCDSANILIDTTAGTSTLLKENTFLSIFPNPANSELNVYLGEITNISNLIEILDINGRVLYSEKLKIGKNKLKINIEHLDSGIYFINLRLSDNRIVSKKWIKL